MLDYGPILDQVNMFIIENQGFENSYGMEHMNSLVTKIYEMLGTRAISIAEDKVRLQESDNVVAQWLQALKDNEDGVYVSPKPRRSTPKR